MRMIMSCIKYREKLIKEAEEMIAERFREEIRRAWERSSRQRAAAACPHLTLFGAGDLVDGFNLSYGPRTTPEGR